MYMCTEVEELMICEELSFYCLQSLFIPPGWSPNVPCRHTNRCCIWRSPFSILYILAPRTAVVEFTSRRTGAPLTWITQLLFLFFYHIKNCKKSDELKVSSPFIFAAFRKRLRWHLRFIWPFFSFFAHVDKSVVVVVFNWRQAFFIFFGDLAFGRRYYWTLTVQTLVDVTVECETLRCWLLTSMETALLLIEGYVCLTHAVWSFKSKREKKKTLILEFCPLQVTTVKLCIIMRNIYYCICFLCNIWLSQFNLVKKKRKKASKCQTKSF